MPSGLYFFIALALASLISRLLFHRDFGSHGFDDLVTGVLSLVLAGVGLFLFAGFTASIWKRARRRLGGPS